MRAERRFALFVGHPLADGSDLGAHLEPRRTRWHAGEHALPESSVNRTKPPASERESLEGGLKYLDEQIDSLQFRVDEMNDEIEDLTVREDREEVEDLEYRVEELGEVIEELQKEREEPEDQLDELDCEDEADEDDD